MAVRGSHPGLERNILKQEGLTQENTAVRLHGTRRTHKNGSCRDLAAALPGRVALSSTHRKS